MKQDGGFSLIEMLFSVTILGFILTALLAIMLRSVNTMAEAKYRANAVAWADSCLDNFKNARAAGWVRFVRNIGDVTCDGANIYMGTNFSERVVAASVDGAETAAGGHYCLKLDGDISNVTGNNGQVKISVQVGWQRFSGDDNTGCDWSAIGVNKNRTATVEQVFNRYHDEQAI